MVRWNGRVVRRADAVVTVSCSSSSAVQRHYRVDQQRIHVIPNGSSPAPTAVPYDAGSEPFFLFVGRPSRRKNLVLALQAMSLLQQRGVAARLVMVGPPGRLSEAEHDLMAQLQAGRRLLVTGFLEEENLTDLYQRSAGLIYPSVCEGFGLPVVEALRLGCPVVVAKHTASAETGAGFVSEVAADDPIELADELQRWLTTPRAPGGDGLRAHLAGFDWELTADRISELLLSRLA